VKGFGQKCLDKMTEKGSKTHYLEDESSIEYPKGREIGLECTFKKKIGPKSALVER
jgi:hypothetical protein